MLSIEAGGRTLRVYVDERLTLFHGTSQPFVAVEHEMRDGRLFQLHSLTRFVYDERRSTVKFYNGKRSLTFELGESDGGLTLTPVASSHSFTGCVLRFQTRPGEPLFGGGAQHPCNLRGRKIVFWSEFQGAYGAHKDADILKSIFAKNCVSKGTYPKLFFHDGAHRWFSVRFDGRVSANFTARDHHSLHLAGLPERVEMGLADDAANIAKHAAPERTVPPLWCREGLMCGVSGGVSDTLRRLDRLVAAGAPIGSLYIRDVSGNGGGGVFHDLDWSRELYPRLPDFLTKLKQRGVRAVAPVTPLCAPGSKLFAAASRAGCLVSNDDGSAALCYPEGTAAATVDLTSEAGADLCARMIAENLLAVGFDGLQCELCDCLPDGAVLSDRRRSEQAHNGWERLWRGVCLRAFELAGLPPLLLDPPCNGSGAGFALGGAQGLRSALGEMLSLSASGFSLSGIDIGAHFDSIPAASRGEIVTRYAELAAFLPLFRLPAQTGFLPDDDDFSYVVRCARLHLALAPYVTKLYNEYLNGALPPVRHMAAEFPSLADAGRLCGQFMLGGLLVAPTLSPGAVEVEATLPEGEWVRLLDGTQYSVDTRGKTVTVGAVPGSPAVFYRRDDADSGFFESLRL